MPIFKREFMILWELLTWYYKRGRWKDPRMLWEEVARGGGPGTELVGSPH